MPGTQDDADAQAAAAAAKAAADAAGAAGAGTKPPKTFTQDELDAILEARLKRAVPADYEELKALKAANDAKAEAEKTELQAAKDEAAAAKALGQAATAKAHTALRKAAIISEATSQNAVDTDAVVALLASNQDVTVDADGNVTGAKAAVKALLTDKPFLAKAGTPGASGGEFRGTDPKTIKDKIADLERQAADTKLSAAERSMKLREARELKLQQHGT